MTRDEYLRETARLHSEWTRKYAHRVAPAPELATPNRSGKSDLALHHADIAAPADWVDELENALDELTDRYHRELDDVA